MPAYRTIYFSQLILHHSTYISLDEMVFASKSSHPKQGYSKLPLAIHECKNDTSQAASRSFITNMAF